MRASVGVPLQVTVWAQDDARTATTGRGGETPVTLTWFKHQGPGPVEFAKSEEPLPALDATATTTATFKQPGDYVIRVRADNFGAVDTSPADQCCWTNGYIKVTVTP